MNTGPLSDAAATAPRTVRALIEAAAQRWPDAVYAVATEQPASLTYAQLRQGCRQVAALLAAQGLTPPATVALVMPNGLGTLQWLLGALHGGYTVNPVNLLNSPEVMRHVLTHSDCRLVLASAEWAGAVQALGLCGPDGAALPVLTVDPDGLASLVGLTVEAETGAAGNPTDPAPHSLALLMYTSGTTGLPKGVMLSQANLVANALAIAAEHQLGPTDRVLGVLPLFHINAFAVTMLAPLASGGSVAMAPRFSAARFWDQAMQHRCTWINVVPTIIAILLEADTPAPDGVQRLRFCRSASSALPPEHLRGFEARFGIGVIETMGLTETMAPSFSNPLDAAQRKLGAVGRASGGEARIIDASLQAVPDGQTGELAIRGPHVMQGYYKNPDATAAAFTPDGWLRTGDLGHRDADGFFFVTGRIKELIIKGGENIAPREIDEVLLRHPAVLEAAAVGMPDRLYGQEILACVVLREGQQADEAALRAFCELHLGRFKTPKAIRFQATLPRGPSGKVQRLKLLDVPAA